MSATRSLVALLTVSVFASLSACPALAADKGLEVRLNQTGVESLAWNGIDLLADGEFKVTGAFFRKPNGDVYAADLAGVKPVPAESPDLFPKTAVEGDFLPALAHAFPWGRVVARYVPTDEATLAIDVGIELERTADELVGLYVQPLALKFPAAPKLTNRSWLFYMSSTMGHNLGAPGFVGAAWDGGTMAVCNEQVDRPLAVGFGPPVNNDKAVLPVLAYTSRHPVAKEKFPWIDRPIRPGGRDAWRITLRFAPPQANYTELVKDLYARYGEAYPYELKWPDRRPIGRCFLSSSDQGWKTNPRGWHHGFGAGKLDISTDEGKEQFKKDLLAYADRAIKVAQDMDAQGVIIWDPEGQEQPHQISYLGDPRSLPPEMLLPVGEGEDAKPVVDVFFGKIRDANLATGICIRPQRPMRAVYGEKVEQIGWVDHRARVANVLGKIRHAKKRWGCTIFYFDSDIEWAGDPAQIPGAEKGYSTTVDAQLLKAVIDAEPDVLVLPEWEDLRSYAYSAPYSQLNYNKLPAPPDYVLATYPQAFFVNSVGMKEGEEHKAALIEAVKRGDILFHTGWYSAPENKLITEIYEAAGAAKNE